MIIDNCKLVELPKISDYRGNLSFVESNNHIPFDINRVYYLYDVPGGAERGGHAHKELHQLIIAISGSFEVTLNDGKDSITYLLNRSNKGLYICPLIWRDLKNFTSGSVCLVLASDFYSEEDYFRDYNKFFETKKNLFK
jgi:dTDP-4-dehydrorhamnose 3,5-epimerase-like enzyme